MEHLDSTIRWLLHYCKKNHIEPPNIDQIKACVALAEVYLNSLPTTPNNQKNQPDSEHNHHFGRVALTGAIFGCCSLGVQFTDHVAIGRIGIRLLLLHK